MSCDPTRPERETCEEIPVRRKKISLNSTNVYHFFLNRLEVLLLLHQLLLHYHQHVKLYVLKVLQVIMELMYVTIISFFYHKTMCVKIKQFKLGFAGFAR